MAGLTTESVRWGAGRHIYYLTPEQIRQGIKYSYIIEPFGLLTLTFGRISFALSLIVLLGVEPWRRWLLYFVIASQAIIHAILLFVLIFACNPIHKYWDREVPGTCLNRSMLRSLGFVQAGIVYISLLSRVSTNANASPQHLCRSGSCLYAWFRCLTTQSQQQNQDGPFFPHESWCIVSLAPWLLRSRTNIIISNLAAATVTFVEYAKVTSIVDITCESHLYCFHVRTASQTLITCLGT